MSPLWAPLIGCKLGPCGLRELPPPNVESVILTAQEGVLRAPISSLGVWRAGMGLALL